MSSRILLKPADPNDFDNEESYEKYKEIVGKRIDNLLAHFKQAHPDCLNKSDFRDKVYDIWQKFAIILSESHRKKSLEDIPLTDKIKISAINFFYAAQCQQYIQLCQLTGKKGSLGFHILPRVIVDFEGESHRIYEDQLLYDAIEIFLEYDPGAGPQMFKDLRNELQELIDQTTKADLSPPLGEKIKREIKSLKFLGECKDKDLFSAKIRQLDDQQKIAHLTSTVEHMKILFDKLVNEIENIVSLSVWEYFPKLFKPLIPNNASEEQEAAINKIINEAIEETITALSKYFSTPLKEHVKDMVESSDSYDYDQSNLITQLKVKIADLNAEMEAREEQYYSTHMQFVSDRSIFQVQVEENEKTIVLNKTQIAWLENRVEYYKGQYEKLFAEINPLNVEIEKLKNEKDELSDAKMMMKKLQDTGLPKTISNSTSSYSSCDHLGGSSSYHTSGNLDEENLFGDGEELVSVDGGLFESTSDEEEKQHPTRKKFFVEETGSEKKNKAKTPPRSPEKLRNGGAG